jgi:YfdX protein
MGVVLALLLAAPTWAQQGPKSLVSEAKLASAQVAAAERALLDEQPGKARVALERAEASLRALYAGATGSGLAQRLQEAETRLRRGERVWLRELASEVERHATVLDPSTIERVHRAEGDLQRGRRDEAARKLRLAREQLGIDFALLPIESAWARVIAAQVAIQRGDFALAQRLLGRVPALLAEVAVRAPLVPIREGLHQAALAAQGGDRDEAELELEEIAEQLREMEAVAEDRIARAFRPLLSQLEGVLGRSEAQRPVRPGEVRELMERANALGEEP